MVGSFPLILKPTGMLQYRGAAILLVALKRADSEEMRWEKRKKIFLEKISAPSLLLNLVINTNQIGFISSLEGKSHYYLKSAL